MRTSSEPVVVNHVVNHVDSQVVNQLVNQAALLKVVMEGGEEVLGQEQNAALFERVERRSQGEAPFSALQAELKETFGPLRGPGVAIRMGRAALKYGLREWGEQAGLTSPAFRLQPAPRRARVALGKLADLLRGQLGAQVELGEDNKHWYWRVEDCPACQGRSAAGPDCHLLTGVLLELLAWSGGGRFYAVREVECRAAGAAACVFHIDKTPLD